MFLMGEKKSQEKQKLVQRLWQNFTGKVPSAWSKVIGNKLRDKRSTLKGGLIC